MLTVVCRTIWDRGRVPSGKHLWSIPVDKQRDFDCMFSDAFDELEAARQRLADVDAALASLRQELELMRQDLADVSRERVQAEALLLQRTQERDLKLADQQVVYEQLREAQAAGETLRARLREMVAAWTTEAARIETFHATMSTGYRACAEQLAALLAEGDK